MKGRIVAIGEYQDRPVAALIVDGIVEDLLFDGSGDQPRPGAIYRAKTDRPMKGQGGMMVKLGHGQGFFRAAKGLRPGQNILVQTTSVPEPGKAVPVTDRLLFKGRAAIVTPGAPGLNISRRITDDEERIRLHDIASAVLGDRNWGLIIRSAAVNLDDDDILDELRDLVAIADQVLSDDGDLPELLVDGPDARELAWRDWADPKPDTIETDGLDHLGVYDAIEAALEEEVPLGNGAYLFVEPTRALVAVDVNTGTDNSPSAGLKANLAAARALPRALRLRGLGGQITVDFAPLSKRDRRQVEQALRAAFKSDAIETALVGWTPLGHFELQRKRERLPISEVFE